MTTFTLDRTASTPSVVLHAEEHRLTLDGECYPEDPRLFFAPVVAALEQHLVRTGANALLVELRLRYVNSAAAKELRRLFGQLDLAGRRGVRVTVRWERDADDDESLELAGMLADALDFLKLEVHAVRPA